jgi:ribosome-associated protein
MPDHHQNPDRPHLDQDAERPSKSELKRQMTQLQKLGEQLLGLPPLELEKMQLPETLLEALALARRIKSREAKRRQLQYIGKLMRGIDAEPIRLNLLQREQGRQLAQRRFHQLEQMRDRLVNNGPGEIEQVMTRFPTADRTRLGHLVRAAGRERDNQKAPKSARSLFRYLRELDEHSSPPDPEPPAGL